MGSLLLSVLVAYGACGPPYGPFALFTSQSVESGWGPSWNGVSLLFATDADTVDMGARMNVEMFFRFLPLESDGRVTAFVGHPEYPPRLVFSEPATETTYVRETSHDMGIGIIDVPALHGHLRAGGFRSQCETFHLLADDGEQIPPGDYQVHLEYSNPGAVERVHWGTTVARSRSRIPPGSSGPGRSPPGPSRSTSGTRVRSVCRASCRPGSTSSLRRAAGSCGDGTSPASSPTR